MGGRGFVAECGAGAEELAKIRIEIEGRKGRASPRRGFHYILHNSKLAKIRLLWYTRYVE